MEEEHLTLESIIADAEKELRGELEEPSGWWNDDVGDLIHSIADSSVPVYTGNLIELAQNDYWLMFEEPEIGPAHDGTPTAINILTAVVYERVSQALWAEHERWKEEQADKDEEEESDADI